MRLVLVSSILGMLAVMGEAATIHVPDDHGTIQQGIDAAVNGDTVLVAPGTYYENIDFMGKAITVCSERGPTSTHINGRHGGSTVTFSSGESHDSVLMDFTITGGQGNPVGSYYYGGGIICSQASPTILRNSIWSNTADNGAGIACFSCTPLIQENEIWENNTHWLFGGDGGGIYCDNASPTIRNNDIHHNWSADYGGGIRCYEFSSPQITCNRIHDNATDGYGGGIDCYSNSSPSITYNHIFKNNAYGSGGGIRCEVYSSPEIRCTIIHDNEVSSGYAHGAGISCQIVSSAHISNTLIYRNQGAERGGGLYVTYGCYVEVDHVTISNNYADLGGGIFTLHPLPITHSIIWGNMAKEENEVWSNGNVDMSYSCVKGGFPGTGNIDGDPLFMDHLGSDFRLKQSPCQPGIMSPCVDAGDPASPQLHGSTREDGKQDEGIPDMGFHYPRTLFVPNELSSIQAAMNAAQTYDTVSVDPGTYHELLDFGGKNITVHGAQGPDVTVIDAGQAGTAVTFHEREGREAVLDGFTIQNGYSTGMAGGVSCQGASPSLRNNRITLNSAVQGGGLCVNRGAPFIEDCRIFANQSVSGGGVFVVNASSEFSGCMIEWNQADQGGGLYFEGGYTILVSSLFRGNHADQGGALYASDGFCNTKCCTFYGNTAQASGGAVHGHGASPALRSSILWNNTAPAGAQIQNSGGTVYAAHCDIQGGWPGTGNLDQDPLFIDPANGDFRLSQDPCQPGVGNPCVDGGIPGSALFRGTTRSDGLQDKGVLDMGYHGPVDDLWLIPGELESITQAIGLAKSGDTVLVSAGTYMENLDFLGTNIILQSEDGPGQTVIDGGQAGSCMVCIGSEGPAAVIEGFTLTNGSGTEPEGTSYFVGGGIFCDNFASPTIINNIITQGSAVNGGGIACFRSASPIIRCNEITMNSATSKGGGIYTSFSSSVITDNKITENSAQSAGGLYSGPGCQLITHNVIEENDAKYGAGISCSGSSVIRNNSIRANTHHSYGCGVEFEYGSTALFEDNTVTENTWGGISVDDCSPVVRSNRIFANTCGWGGGISCTNEAAPVIVNNVIFNNLAFYSGGGIHCHESFPVITNNTIFDNHSNGEGGGLMVQYESNVTLENNIFWGNTSPKGPEMKIGWNNKFNLVTIRNSDVQGGENSVLVQQTSAIAWGAGMIDSDPLFADPSPAIGDFHLTHSSPCRNTGYNGAASLPDMDMEDDPRITDGTADMGADEFHTHLYATGDFTPGGPISLHFVDNPGSAPVVLILGFSLFDPPLPTLYGDLYIQLPLTLMPGLGPIPASGIQTLSGTLPPSTPVPSTFFLQARIGNQLTNLFTVNVE